MSSPRPPSFSAQSNSNPKSNIGEVKLIPDDKRQDAVAAVDGYNVQDLIKKAKGSPFGSGDIECAVFAAYYLIRFDDFRRYQGYELFKNAAKKGHEQSKVMMGFLHTNDMIEGSTFGTKHHKKDFSKASAIFKEHSEAGNILATKCLADLYNSKVANSATPKDDSQAFLLYNKALTLNDNSTYYYYSKDQILGDILWTLGDFYLSGRGVRKDITMALECYAKGFNLGCKALNPLLNNYLFMTEAMTLLFDKIFSDRWSNMANQKEEQLTNWLKQICNLIEKGDHYALGSYYLEQFEKYSKALQDEHVRIKSTTAPDVGIAENVLISFNKEIARSSPNPKIFYELSRICRLGLINVNPDPSQAVAYLIQGAELGLVSEPEAQYELGCFYAEQKDEPTALSWLVAAANQQHYQAAYKREQILKASPHHLKLPLIINDASRNDAAAQFKIGDFFYKDGDIASAIAWNVKSANQKYKDALVARKEFIHGHTEEMLPYLFDEISNGKVNPSSGLYEFLGEYYLKTKSDPKSALSWYDKAAYFGRSQAKKMCEVILYNNPSLKLPYLIDNANKNIATAQHDLGLHYFAANNIEAFVWFSKAAAQNHFEAYHGLGQCYEQGLGVDQNYFQAAEHYAIAAKNNSDAAKIALTKLYKAFLFDILKADKRKTDLNLQYTKFTDSDLLIISALLKVNAMINTLDLRNTSNSEENIKKLAKALEGRPTDLSILHDHGSPVLVFAASPVSANSPTSPLSPITSYMIDYNEIEFSTGLNGEPRKILGKGSFGTVYQGTWRRTAVAVKELIETYQGDALAEFKHEAEVMYKLQSEYLVRLYGVCINTKFCLVQEYMPNGSLYQFLQSKSSFTWENKYKVITDVACGVLFLHAADMTHRDIKSLNVLLRIENDKITAKLSDFGETKEKAADNQSDAVGTLPWMAPELFEEKPIYSKKSDIYSLGILFWEVASGERPCKDVKSYLIPTRTLKGEREKIPTDCPTPMGNLIKKCWQANPDDRPTIKEVLTDLDAMHESEEASLSSYAGNLYTFKN